MAALGEESHPCEEASSAARGSQITSLARMMELRGIRSVAAVGPRSGSRDRRCTQRRKLGFPTACFNKLSLKTAPVLIRRCIYSTRRPP